jgi:hypothetical protein
MLAEGTLILVDVTALNDRSKPITRRPAFVKVAVSSP